ncbi:MAG: hypothetical protein NPIRA05_12270 [Nitrospirales bacterium]|nr:MAG: hypothetical protein NPIRA05_12270 [Nitrospirales bacterium]
MEIVSHAVRNPRKKTDNNIYNHFCVDFDILVTYPMTSGDAIYSWIEE